MDTLIHEGKYKIIELLAKEEGFRACLCIDVETNNHYKPMIFNIYEDSNQIRSLLPLFYNLKEKGFNRLINVMSGKHNITGAFEYFEGKKINEFFKNIDENEFVLRCKCVNLMLEECLILDTAPDFMAYECLESEKMVYLDTEEKVRINYIIRPVNQFPSDFKSWKTGELMKCIFVQNRYVPDMLWDFIYELENGHHENMVSIFSRWRELQPVLLEEHQKLRQENLTGYIWRRIKAAYKNRKRHTKV